MERWGGVIFLLAAFSTTQIQGSKLGLKNVCRETGTLKNGVDLNPRFKWKLTGSVCTIDTVKCKWGYTMNVQNMEEVFFKMTEDSMPNWQAFFKKNGQKIKDLYLKNITCKDTAPCFQRPAYPENGWYFTPKKIKNYCYKVKGLSRCIDTYYVGDQIYYLCKGGFTMKKLEIIKPTTTTTTTTTPTTTTALDGDSDNEYNYYEYGDNYVPFYAAEKEENGVLVETEPWNPTYHCGANGQWSNGQKGAEGFPTCEKIQCDGTRFINISNGFIHNLTDIYDYGEMLELSCDEGYRPINNENQLKCLDREMFADAIFGCERVVCPEVVYPYRSEASLVNRTRYVGDQVEFECTDQRYILLGPKRMTCMENGKWDSELCVRCISKDDDCPPPCMHADNIPSRQYLSFKHGSEIEIKCNSNPTKNVTRMCLKNNRWSHSDLYCTDRVDPLKVLEVSASLTHAMRTMNNVSKSKDGIVEKKIREGRPGGVDVYFLLDVSGSISMTNFSVLRNFTIALVNELDVSNKPDGTRIAVYAFAEEMKTVMNCHDAFHNCLPFPSTKRAVEKLEKVLVLEELRKPSEENHIEIGSSTNIVNALTEIQIEIKTKVSMSERGKLVQNVLILISDGEINADGNPETIAQEIKNGSTEIYSIYLGGSGSNDETTKAGEETMKKIASSLPNEEHFIQVGQGEMFEHVINAMINRSTPISCGGSKPHKTEINRANAIDSRKVSNNYAWPWMTLLKGRTGDGEKYACGGSVIDRSHVLTAAHCVDDFSELSVQFGSNNQEQTDKDMNKIEMNVEKGSVIIHEKFNKSTAPKLQYDIALIKLDFQLEYSYAIKPICLPDPEEKILDSVMVNKTYGIVAGWGDNSEVLKQIQVAFQEDETCLDGIFPKKRNKKQFDSKTMFCAGGKDGKKHVDTLQGDSGGPFMLEHPNKENTFVQCGIVSNEIEGNNYGIYTKLTEDLVKWINKKIKSAEAA